MLTQKLQRWGAIEVEGPDALTFLQSQLSNDIAQATETTLTFASYCTAKGRMLGSFFIVKKSSEQFFLLCRQETIIALVKRLSMFVMRSKCKVSDASAILAISYLADQTHCMSPCTTFWRCEQEAIVTLRATSQQNLPAFVLSLTDSAAIAASPLLDEQLEADLWDLGIFYITQATTEQFVPQAVNFDLVGGVSFSKGCYPGQEIVARSHYLGKSKKRMFKAQIDHAVSEGNDIWLQGKDNEPVASIANQVHTNGTSLVLLEGSVDLLEARDVSLFIQLNGENFFLKQIQAPAYDIHAKGNQFEGIKQ